MNLMRAICVLHRVQLLNYVRQFLDRIVVVIQDIQGVFVHFRFRQEDTIRRRCGRGRLVSL